MASNTYVALDKITLGSAVSSVTFSSIPATYTDLIIVVNHTSSVGVGWFARFNGDTATNYSMTYVGGNGSATESVRETNATCTRVGNAYPTIGTTIIQIQNYSNNTTYKTHISRTNNSSNFVAATVGLWRSTAAINSVTLLTNTTATFQTGTTFTLYGVAADTGAYTPRATGGTITADQFWIYHTFTGSGSFVPSVGLTADVLVIAGGGSGSSFGGAGGGGAGGVQLFSSQNLTPSSYTCTVGGGGAGVSSGTNGGTKGTNSQFGSLTASVGGGAGDASSGTAQVNGGSGGGSRTTSAGTGTSGQGYGGGTGLNLASYPAGGGGGAAGAGANNSGDTAGSGGTATSAYSSWLSATSLGVSGAIAGGGGGSAYAAGGGVQGAGGGGGATAGADSNSSSATANTGSGSGGATLGSSGNGGSGVIVVRYAK